ncbi:hypothetical protein IMZ48_02380 [Candidatus Bathyarchaeota archaeon]|nr:hypothetical protein [Candidatus Bathyarchaeota archaeon]
MYNHTPDNARGGLGPRHGEDPSFSGGSHGLGIANSQHHQHQHQQYSQPQVHDPHQQSHFPSDFGFVSSTPHDPPSMNDYSASMGHGQAQYQTQGDAMDVEDTNESKPRVTNLIKQFETRSRRPSRSGHNVPGSASTAFARATNSLGVASPNAEQFTSSLRVRSGSIGRPPPIRFGSMGQQGHSGLRVASPMASQAREAHGNREHNPTHRMQGRLLLVPCPARRTCRRR